MDERQHWMQRLDEFLQFRRDGGNAEVTIADDKAVVGQWISYALERDVRPDERNDELLRRWVTAVADLAPLTQDNCRAHMSPWWRWNQNPTDRQDSVRGRPPENPADRCGTLYATNKWGPHYCACGSHVNNRIEKDAATYVICRKTSEVVWVGAPINRTVGGKVVNRVVEATKLPTYKVGDKWLGPPKRGVDPRPRNSKSSSQDMATWLLTLESYLHWRSWAGGNDGEGAKPDTIKTVRSVIAGWIRWAWDSGIDPGQADEAALSTYLDSKQNASADSRSGYARHIRRWWKRQIPFMEARPERLARLVAEFRDEGNNGEGYPCDADRQHTQVRAEYEQILRSLPSMSWENRDQVKAVWPMHAQGINFGGAGLGSGSISKTVNDASAEQWTEIRSTLWELCFGQQDDDAERFDTAVDGPVKGLAELVATRLLAICHPDRFLANFKLQVDDPDWPGTFQLAQLMSALKLLDESGQSEVDALGSFDLSSHVTGAAVARTHTVLVSALEPEFSEDGVPDTWGMRGFLYWLARRFSDSHESAGPSDGGGSGGDEPDPTGARLAAALQEAGKDLLCGEKFLNDVVELLEDKGQVILYGPPGTGKTHFARHLGWTLLGIVDDEEYEDNPPFSLVQFHPAYSYEEFFEGFRPQVDDDGQMTYELMPGPLVRLAERAADHPDELHVMVIDEINRANLPRVLGELLYLLEYRDDWVQTQYRPVDGFMLPSNLWFIGTMNTADRSIALIDAAMRRRFHFVPFFPDREPTAGLLRRWCERNAPGQEWMADLLDAVNQRLRSDLGGDYMLIGPSHFMKQDLDENGLRRIWEYNIEPLIEDQFFGRQEIIDEYRFSRIWSRHGPDANTQDAETGVPDEPAGDNDPQPVDGDSTAGDEDE